VFNFQYVPILKGRSGEYGALEMLPSDLKGLLLPIIEIPPIPWNHSTKMPGKTVDKHLQKVGANIERAWGPNRPILLDFTWIENGQRMADGTHPATYVFAAVRARGVQALPVTGLLRDHEYQEAYRDAIHRDGRGFCLRLQKEDFDDVDNLDTEVARLLSYFGSREREVDLILDLRFIDGRTQIEDVVAMIDAQLFLQISWEFHPSQQPLSQELSGHCGRRSCRLAVYVAAPVSATTRSRIRSPQKWIHA